ncbi:ATP-binding protein [Spirillospora sp. NPDC048832]
MVDEGEVDLAALTDELGRLSERGLPRAFKRLDKRSDPLELPRLQAIAERDVPGQWRDDRVAALEALLRHGIERLDGTVGTTDVSRQRAAAILFNLSFQDVRPLDMEGRRWSSEIKKRLVDEFQAQDSTVRRYSRQIRKVLARILIDSPMAPQRADGGTREASEVVRDFVQNAPALKDSRRVRELVAVSAAYVRDVRIDKALYVPRTIEGDLFEKLSDTAHSWPRAVIGEAGAGKSTLLWSLYRELAAKPHMVPMLLPATWLLGDTRGEPVEKLLGALQDLAQAGRSPVLLLDTADLMLHDEEARQMLLRLVDTVHTAGFTGVYSTRPQEAALLAHDELRPHHLLPYDDAEIDRAVAALVDRYCPAASRADVTERVQRATARGLPVADVCRSPLLLRMLFDLSAPDEPELDDVDVTRLFDAYWQRRVIRDARTDTETGLRARAADNLSILAGHTAVGLLASGLPELPGATLRDTTGMAAGPQHDPAVLEEGLDVLTERGVLVHSGDQVGFFHQTMFEFAAAKGLLARSDPAVISTLTTRTTGHGGDLFVGAVLEQVLILAGTNPLLQDALRDAVRSLVTSGGEAVQAIGLVAWAHYPALLDDSPGTLRKTGASALERATRILPTIAAKPTGQTISQLMLVWEATKEPRVRTAVLDAFARLALRVPRDVADALEHLNPLQVFTGTTATEGMRRSLLGVLHTVSSKARLLVRSTLVAMLMRPDDRGSIELDYLADQWHDIGDDHLLAEVVRALDAYARPSHAVAAELGRLIAAEWRRTGIWDEPEAWTDFLADSLGAEGEGVTPEAEAAIRAIGAFTVALNDEDRIRLAVEALLDAQNPHVRDLVQQTVLRDILSSGSKAAAILEEVAGTSLATIGDAAQRGMIDDRQRLLLDLLAQSQVTEGAVARLIPRQLVTRDWTSDARLLRLVPAAADQGHAAARQFLKRVRHGPPLLSPAGLDTLFSTRAARDPRSDDVFDALLSIAVQAGRTADLEQIVRAADSRGGRIDAYGPVLLRHARDLLTGGDDEAKRRGGEFLAELMGKIDIGMAWPELRAVFDDVGDQAVLVRLIEHLWNQTPVDDVSAQLEYLGQFIVIEPDAGKPVARPGGRPVNISVAVASAWAVLYLLGRSRDADADDWPTIRTLGLYEVEQDAVFVETRRLLIVSDYLARLGRKNPRQAGENLIEYLEKVAAGEFRDNFPKAWRRELRNAVQHACAHGDQRIITGLVATCRTVDFSIAEEVLTAIAERHYADARKHLQALGRADISATLRGFVIDLVRAHDRSFGTRAFPEILA